MKHTKHRIGLVDETPQVAEKNKSGAWFVIILLLFAVGQTGFVFWQKHTLNRDIALAKEKIETKEATIKELTSGTTFDEHSKGADILEDAEEKRIDWSGAENELARLRGLLQANVIMDGYTSDPQGAFVLQGIAGSVEGVAVAIDKLKESKIFSDHFVTTIAQQDNPGEYSFNGIRPRSVYRFTVTFNYN